MSRKKTRPIGVRVPADLYESIKEDDPAFNLSKFVTAALVKQYESIEDKVDRALKQNGMI